MSAKGRRRESHAELARLVRDSDLLEPRLKRQWLEVLPYLSPNDQLRLRVILSAGDASTLPSTPGHTDVRAPAKEIVR